MHLHIKFYNETISIKHDPKLNPTILSLKNTIELKLSLPIELQSLTFIDEINLPDYKTLESYGIENHSHLNLKIISETDYKEIFLAARHNKLHELKELGVLMNGERSKIELDDILDKIKRKQEAGIDVHLEEFSPYKLHKLPLERAKSVKSNWGEKSVEINQNDVIRESYSRGSSRTGSKSSPRVHSGKSNFSLRFADEEKPRRRSQSPILRKQKGGFQRPKNLMFQKIEPGCLSKYTVKAIRNEKIKNMPLRASQISLPKTCVSDDLLDALPVSNITVNTNFTHFSRTELPTSEYDSSASTIPSRLPSALFSSEAGDLKVRCIEIEDEKAKSRVSSGISSLGPSQISLDPSSNCYSPSTRLGTAETIKIVLSPKNPKSAKNIKKYENYRIFISILGAISNDNVEILRQIYNEHQNVFLSVKSQISKRNTLHFCCCHRYENDGNKKENNSLVTSLYNFNEIRKILHDKDYRELTPARLAKSSGRTDNAQILLKFDWELRTNSINFGKTR